MTRLVVGWALRLSIKIVYWEEDAGWIGYLQEYPDYWTQGETLEELQEQLRDLYKDVTSGFGLPADST